MIMTISKSMLQSALSKTLSKLDKMDYWTQDIQQNNLFAKLISQLQIRRMLNRLKTLRCKKNAIPKKTVIKFIIQMILTIVSLSIMKIINNSLIQKKAMTTKMKNLIIYLKFQMKCAISNLQLVISLFLIQFSPYSFLVIKREKQLKDCLKFVGTVTQRYLKAKIIQQHFILQMINIQIRFYIPKTRSLLAIFRRMQSAMYQLQNCMYSKR